MTIFSHLFSPAVTVETDEAGQIIAVGIDWADSHSNSIATNHVTDLDLPRDHASAVAACNWVEEVLRPGFDAVADGAVTRLLDKALAARVNAEERVAVLACREIIRLALDINPNAVAVLVETSDQNDRDQLVACSVVSQDQARRDSDEQVTALPDDNDVGSLAWTVGLLDAGNDTVWNDAIEHMPSMRLNLDKLASTGKFR